MLIRTCMAKIHRATVTEADLNYVGSITIDQELLEKSGMRPFQYVNITNLRNGIFWQTYIIAGPRGNGDICLNGPPAHHFQPGDKVIILAEAWLEPSELKDLDPVVVFVDDKNKITEVKKHKAIPVVVKWFKEKVQTYTEMKKKTGLMINYSPREGGGVDVEVVSSDSTPITKATFPKSKVDQAHILYIEATELLDSRAKLGEDAAAIRKKVEGLFAAFRGEKVSFVDDSAPVTPRRPSGEFIANPGKKIEIDVDGVTYQRLPVRTRLITMRDTDIMPLLEEYVAPFLKPDDIIFVSEKALTVTQGRIVDISDIKPTRLARLLARNVGNYYGSTHFRGFGHGTALAMQLCIEEAGYARVVLAAVVAALTRPLGIHGMFYRICGKRAKSIDCPMSFLILEYAHSAKLAPNDPNGAARRIKERLGCEVVILDANYRGAFSLGKSTRAISESFIGKLFRDNPLGQSDEMTPFAIVRKS
jgi:L-aspartate-alpha-decarboxylase